MTERNVRSSILRMIKREFPQAYVMRFSEKWISGYPDLLIILQGIHIFIELKKPGGKIKKIQTWTAGKILDAGGHAYVADNMHQVRCILLGAQREAMELSKYYKQVKEVQGGDGYDRTRVSAGLPASA